MPAGVDAVSPLDPDHLGPEAVRRYLRDHNLRTRRRYSQSFLADGEVVRSIVAAAGPAPGRRVLEIGPGLGILTGPLLEAGAAVTAIEIDRDLVAHLRLRFRDALARAERREEHGSLRLLEADILDTPIESVVAPPYDLAANLPYHITSPVLHRVLGAGSRPERLTLMLQREVAERITSPPGGMSYLSVFVQYHADVEIVRIVPASAFEPQPEVESAVVHGATREGRLRGAAEDELWRLVQAGFRERRKMIHNVLARQLPGVDRARVLGALEAVGVDPNRRPQTLSVGEWLALARALGPLDA